MTLTVVTMSKNEADIAADFARHCYKQGADRIIAADGMSTDGTPDILRAWGVDVVEDRDPYCRQADVMSALARSVGEGWIVPADMDEFWVATGGQTVADLLENQPEEVGRYYATVYHHTDREHRWPVPKLPKVAFRWSTDCQLEMGNHEVNVGGQGVSGELQVRELQFRGRDHYHRKVRERLGSLSPDLLPGDAEHYKRLDGMSVEQLDEEWTAIVSKPTIWDPIP